MAVGEDLKDAWKRFVFNMRVSPIYDATVSLIVVAV